MSGRGRSIMNNRDLKSSFVPSGSYWKDANHRPLVQMPVGHQSAYSTNQSRSNQPNKNNYGYNTQLNQQEVKPNINRAPVTAAANNTPANQKNTKQTVPPQQQIKVDVAALKPPAPLQVAVTPITIPSTPKAAPDLHQVPPPDNLDAKMEVDDVDNEDGKAKKYPWKKSGGKVRKLSNRERRGRQNKRLRKILTPKNALMVLNELQGAAVPEYKLAMTSGNFQLNNQYMAEVVVNGTSYQGQGISKVLAKNHAAEQAIRDLVIARMNRDRERATSVTEEEIVAEGSQQQKDNESDLENGVPMLHLASYALHKLFLEWQSEGYEIPLLAARNGVSISATSEILDQAIKMENEKKPTTQGKPKKELPQNAAAMHPTMLLSQMRPGCQYEDLGVQGTSPATTTFTVGVNVDGQQYIGSARNKKEARRLAAQQACIALGVQYDENTASSANHHPQPIFSVVN